MTIVKNTESAHIKLRDIHVTGINTMLRAQGLKQFVFGLVKGRGLKLAGKLTIPIVRGVSLDIREGERVGIIGHNGSGKSSLLKVIAGIYPPSVGTVGIAGKIAPLIEMGIGFDPEMTGRQNIQLGLVYSGRILDHTPELEEAIIDFTELGDHIDRPMKGYSSGMMGRLCFAVSVFQSPDILLLDEAFAAGDALFVEKARQVMIEKFNSAAISVLVTHDLSLVEKFCNRCIWMHHGQIREDGNPKKILDNYDKYIKQFAQ